MEEKREALQGLKIRSAESTALVLMGGAMANIRKTRTDEHNFVVEVISSWLSRR